MSLRSVNLNLIPVLRSLLAKRSVVAASQSLGMSQSATSDALAKLRVALKDPLLVRLGNQTKLTARATSLIQPVNEICERLQSLVAPPTFNADASTRTFVIATSDDCIYLMGPSLLAALKSAAPRVRLQFIEPDDSLANAMASRRVDLSFLPSFVIQELSATPLHTLSVYRDRSVVVFRKGHPLEKVSDQVRRNDLKGYRAVVFQPESRIIDRKHGNLYVGGRSLNVAASLPYATLVPKMLVATDYFSILPHRLAIRMAATAALQIRTLSFASAEIEMSLAWSPVSDADPGHVWFRYFTQAALSSPPSEPFAPSV